MCIRRECVYVCYAAAGEAGAAGPRPAVVGGRRPLALDHGRALRAGGGPGTYAPSIGQGRGGGAHLQRRGVGRQLRPPAADSRAGRHCGPVQTRDRVAIAALLAHGPRGSSDGPTHTERALAYCSVQWTMALYGAFFGGLTGYGRA